MDFRIVLKYYVFNSISKNVCIFDEFSPFQAVLNPLLHFVAAMLQLPLIGELRREATTQRQHQG